MTRANSIFRDVEDLSSHIRTLFDGELKAALIYAFNTTGKTRLAGAFEGLNEDPDSEQIVAMNYGAFFEDIFHWDNDSYTLLFDVEYSWITRLIRDEGLENRIVDRFKLYSFSRVEPAFNLVKGSVSFRIARGNEVVQDNIKISRGEESLLIWSIYRAILELAIETLEDAEDDRTLDIFNNLRYVIVDDPVSSIDDTKIIDIALDLVDITKRLAAKNVKVLIMTHHALFYSVIANSLPKEPDPRSSGYRLYNLTKTNEGLMLKGQGDSPFAYHLFAKSLIQEAIRNNTIERYHFNLFRALLEKTANFIGSSDWTSCLSEDNRKKFKNILHIYSHGRLSDVESKELSSDEKDAFTTAFNQFIQDYRWGR